MFPTMPALYPSESKAMPENTTVKMAELTSVTATYILVR
jgi:hypothetical protein